MFWFSQGSSTIYAYSYSPVNDTYMTAWFDLSGGAIVLHDLSVYNEIDGTMTLYDSFTINSSGQPESISVNPNSAQQDEVLRVVISGQDTHFDQGSSTDVWFTQGSPTCTNFWILSDTLLVAEFDLTGVSPGLRDLNVYNDIDGTLTLSDSFTVTAYDPKLTSVTPAGAYQGQKLSVRISGQNTSFEQGSGSVVWLSQGSSLIVARQANAIGEKFNQPGSGIAVIADFDIPTDANSGMWDVHTFSEVGGQLTLTDGFMIVQPGDWTSDGVVNFLDLAVIAKYWLQGGE